ncbi:MAG TPA: carbohydrate-binding protein [Rhizobiaceae bacterium]|nr:carbohydrate-binding protein [Rhizobiaceae bacterium]
MELDTISGAGGSVDDQPTTVTDLVQWTGNGSRSLRRSSEFTVSVPDAGPHELLVKFANGWKQERSAILEIAGLGANELKFPPTGSWSNWETRLFTVELPAGEIVLSIVNTNESGPDIAGVHLNARNAVSRGLAIGDDAITAMSTAGIAALALALNLDEVQSKQPEADLTESRAVSDELASPEAGQDTPQVAQNQNPISTPGESSSEDPDLYPGSSSPIIALSGTNSPGSSSMVFAKVANPEIPGLDPAPRGEMQGRFGALSDDGGVQPMQLGSDVDSDDPDGQQTTPPNAAAPEGPDDTGTDEPDTDTPTDVEPNEGFQPMRLEAETATRGNSGGTQTTTPNLIAAGNPGNTATDNANADAASGDTYVDFAGLGSNFNGGSGEYIEWTFEVPAAGVYDLAFGYAFNSGAAVDRPMNLKVNGQLWDRLFEMPATASNTSYSEALTRVTLQEGVNTVRLTTTGYSGPNLDYLDVRPADPGRIVIQAESLLPEAAPNVGVTVNRPITLPYLASNTASEQFRAGAEGDSYLDWGSAANQVTIPVTAATAGTYEIVITYANGGAAARNLQLLASDDALLGTFNFSPTAALPAYLDDYLDIPANLRPTDGSDAGTVPDPTGWESWRKEKLSVSVHLDAGANLFKLSGTNGPNIDKIEFILIDADNSAPEAEALAVTANEDTTIVIDVADHIGDVDGDALTVSADVPVSQGTVSVSGTVITFTPAAHFNGEATISYTVRDPGGLTSTANITVDVAAVNDAPAIAGVLEDATVSAEGGSIDLSVLTKADADGDATTFGIRLAGGGALPAGITVSGAAILVDSSVAAGEYELEVFATDGALESSAISVTLTKPEAGPEPDPFDAIVLQAEDGALTVLDTDSNTNDTTVRDPSNPEASNLNLPNNLRPGFTGTGYLDFGDTPGDKVTLSFTVPAGTYEIHIRYASNTARPLAFSLDGAGAVNLPFASTDPDGAGPQEGFNNWLIQKTTVTVAAGTHTISLAIPAGANTGPNIDAIAITQPGEAPSFFVPVFTGPATASFAENSLGTVLDLEASDGDGTALTYGLSGNGADDALFDIDPATGILTFKAAPDFETGGDNAYSVEVTVTDGASTVTQTVTVTVTDVNEAPASVTVDGTLTLAEDAAAGTVVGSVSGIDPDAGDTLTFTVDDPRFTVNASGEIVIAEGARFDFESEPAISLTITATDGSGLAKTHSVTLGVTDIDEQVGPVNVAFSPSALTSYSPQDVGTGASISDDGATLDLNGNLWKRAALGQDYTITANTKLVFTYTIGQSLPEIVAIGFDDDNSPFESADKSVYQIAGTETQPAFVDLRGGVSGAPGTTATIVIDLSAHAGKTISSLVFIADDDTPGNGIGSASFSNVQLTETPTEVENVAPDIVGGGIADLVVDERSSLEIDLPFLDENGDELTYSFAVTDALGNPVAGFEGLSVEGGVLAGPINAAPSAVPYVVTITADDGKGGQTSLSFDLTVENVNEAPVIDPGVAFEPYFGKIGTEIAGIDLNLFKDAFSDPDGDPLTLTVEGLPAGLQLNSEGVIVGTPTEAGTGSFKVVATDPEGLRTELVIQLEIEGAGVGDVTVIEAEHFTGLSSATNFYLAATAGASGNQIIRTDANEAGVISTNLAQNGLTEGWYEVSITVYDETDGTAHFSLQIGDTLLAEDVSFSEGIFDNNQPRGNAGQAGNLKTITFTTPVFVDATTIALLTGQADAGENLRIDKLTFTRVAAPELPPSAVTLSPAAIDENVVAGVIGTLSANDPDGDESALVYTTTDSRFTIVGNELRLADGVSLDHEAGETVTVAVTATDAQGLSTTTNIQVVVGDVNEAPVLAPGAAIEDVTLTQGGSQAIDLAAALGATDPDAGDAVTYNATLVGGGQLPAGISLVGSSLQIGDQVAPGTYEIEVLASDGDLNSESVSFTVTIEEEGEPEPFLLTIQAETGALTVLDTDANTNDTTIRDPSNPETGNNPQLVNGLRPGFTGSGYVDFGDTVGDKVTYTFDVPTAGTYTVNIRYASNGARPLDLSVNGGAVQQLPFVETGTSVAGPDEGFNNWGIQTFTVVLQAGTNTLSLAIPAGFTSGPNLDSLEIVGGGAVPDTSADADEQPLFLSGPDGPLSGAAKDSINFQLAGIDSDIVKVELSFDGGATRVEVFPDADGDFTVDGTALNAGDYVVTAFVTDDAGNVASKTMAITVAGAAEPFSVTIEGETFSATDSEATPDTVARTPANPEPQATPTNSGPGLTFDASGLRPGYEGTGYMDMGNDIGDKASFTIDAPEAGTYQLTIRYANGGTTDRPMTLTVGSTTQTIAFASTAPVGATTDVAWSTWGEFTIDIELAAGTNTISFTNTIANGPNIDNVTVSRDGVDPVDPREQIRFEEVVKINFQPPAAQTTQGLPSGYQTPEGYLADVGSGYGDRGNGFSYGWVTEESVADGTANGTIAASQPANAHWYKNTVSGASDLQKTYAHFEYPGGGVSRAWELGLEDGTYQVTLSIGDTAGAFDSLYAINVEGQKFMPNWVPANEPTDNTNGGGFRSTLVTGIVTVTDGRLTIDSIGGTNTEIQYLEVEKIEDLTPGDGRTADKDYSYFVAPVADTLEGQVSIALGPNGELPVGIDPTAMFVIGVTVQADGNRGPNIAHTENIKLVETLTGIEVEIDVQISGGADSLTIRPLQPLKENTSYTLKVQDVMDLGSITDPDAPLRQMQDLTTTFVTGEAPEDVAREVAFTTDVLLNGFADGAGGYTSIEFGPDGKLYVATITGEIHRWNVNPDGTIDKNSQETVALDYLDAGGGERRGIVGFVFDPNDPNTIWITDNAPIPREQKAFDTPEFSGRVSKITLGAGGSLEDATAETYIRGLPRSGADHLSNSLEFRRNPDFGEPGEPEYLLYMSQGSNSAAGAPDGAWGNRPERLLNAAILEIDPTRKPPAGGYNVQTEPISTPTTQNPASAFNEDGTYPGFYNPYAEDAVLKIYATGVRNAYDLVWHSNGHLYVPTNGTASGGKTPNDPTQPGLDTVIANSPKQYDYFFNIDEGGYYGHPNVLRDEYILNGGNPTSGLDPNEVVGGNDGNPGTDGYQVGVDPDPDYDLDGVYNLGYNRSPNGAIEYTGNAFGSNLKGAILFAQFSTGDNVRMIRVDANGNIIGDDVLRRPDGSVINNYIDPLDIIQNPVTGQLYLMTLNRGTGASQLILLTPAPGGVTEDVTANEGGDLALVAFDVSDPSAAVFQVNGLDDDITAIRVRFNNGPETTVTLDAQNRFTIDVSNLTGPVTATIRVTDDDLNEASTSTTFTPGEEPAEYVTLLTIQAEDKTPGDGTAVTVPTGSAAQIQIRDAGNLETGTGPGYVNGLRPGAVGLDGNTDNTDGTPGGYADFGSTNADYLTFTFDVPSGSAGSAILRFRYSNGATADRPLQIEVNGTIVNVQSFLPTSPGASVDGWTVWSTVEIPASLVAGQNTVTLRSVEATGPNIDQLEVLVPNESGPGTPNDGEIVIDGVTYVLYEAENAASTGSPAIVSEDRNQSGDFVDFLGPDNETLTWTVEVPAAGVYGIDILYALASTKAARPMALLINGNPVETLPFAPNSSAAEDVWGPQSATLQLNAGVNTITITAPAGVAPNIDLLRITKEPLSPFEPDYAEIDGSGRIELEAQDGSAHIVNGSTVEFYFTVDADGVYKIDAAANANAANGQGLTWYLNGVRVDESDFPGVGLAGEESVYLTLEAGTQYQIKIVSDAPGAAGIDYLDVSPAPGNANADIAVQSLDPAYLDDRLHFSFLENPSAVDPDAPPRDFKDSGTVRISNTGTEPLTFTEAELSGPFVLANPAIFDGLTLAPGQSIDVTVLFNRAAYTPPTSNVDATSTVFTGELTLVTNDAENPVTTVDLAGFWQSRDEGGHEPNVNEIWRIFGFGNVIENLTTRGGGENSALSTNDVFAKTDPTEVLSPYWRIADGHTSAKMTQLAAFHGTGGATMGIHNPGNKGQGVTFWNHEGTDNQRLLPNSGNDSTFSTRTFTRADVPDGWAGNDAFGFTVAGLSSDPRLNPTGGVIVPGAQQGHTVKIFQALDQDGNVIPNVFLGIMDYTGINYDYNDNIFVIEGVEPVGFGQDLRIAGLDDAAADERLVFTNIDNPANAQQSFRNEAVLTIANDGFAPLNISSIVLGDTANFEIVGTIPTMIAAGGSAQITVRYIGTHSGTAAGADLHTSTLTINSDDYAEGAKVIQLAGLAQEFSENNSEPTVAQIVEAFGYGTDMAQGELAGGGVVETIGDEVLMPYLQKLDTGQPIQVIQIAAFLNQGNVARLGYHQLNSSAVTNLFANDDQQGQTVLPDQLVAGSGAGATVARGTITQNGPFGLYISVDGRPTYSSWSDPEANRIDPNFGQLVGDNQGHLIRFFQALDADGNVIEGTYIGIQDYPGAGNYDYNDHMFIIKNVKPYELTSTDDANDDGVNDALQNDTDNDGTVNFFDPNSNPPQSQQQPFGGTPFAVDADGVVIDADDYDTGGQGVAYNDTPGLQGGTNGGRAGSDVEVTGSGDVGWIDPGEWLEYTIDVDHAGVHDIGLLLSNGGGAGRSAVVTFYRPGETTPYVTSGTIANPQTATWTTFVNRPGTVTLEEGEQIVRVTFSGGSQDFRSLSLKPVIVQTPFGGTAPGFTNGTLTVDATNFDEGGQGVAYNDNPGLDGGAATPRPGRDVEFVGGGNDIGYVKPGEWVEYTINVPTAGIYTFSANAKTPVTGATISVSLNGTTQLGVVTLADGHAGGSNFDSAAFSQSPSIQLALSAGVQTLRLTFDGPLAANGYVLDLASFTLQLSGQQPFGGTAPVLDDDGLTIDAVDYDDGGQGVAYNDAPGLQGGTNGGRAGSSVEVTAGGNVGWIGNGEWMEYTINVAEAGPYVLNLSMALGEAGGPNRSVTATFTNGGNVETVTIATPRTGTWTNFQDTQDAFVDLAAGTTVVRLTFNGGSQDLESFRLEPAASAAAASAVPETDGQVPTFLAMQEQAFDWLDFAPSHFGHEGPENGTPPLPHDPIHGYDLMA